MKFLIVSVVANIGQPVRERVVAQCNDFIAALAIQEALRTVFVGHLVVRDQETGRNLR